jgi:putative ABC transport system ATP-binding protein/lipoprotein-releasing system ATP-binding protein
MHEPLVDAKGISRSFPTGLHGVRQVLKTVDCRVFPGERIAISGPSGSGKSTLLNILSGLDEPNSGEVSWPGLARSHPSAKIAPMGAGDGGRSPGGKPTSREVGIVFQTESLLPALTVLENVCLPLMLTGDTSAMEPRALQMLEAFDLGGLADKLPSELSGGQAQRAAIARAFITGPQLILADEPTGQLDHPTAQHVLDVILRLVSDRRTALVVATHDETIAARMTRQWVLDQGRLVEGTMERAGCS